MLGALALSLVSAGCAGARGASARTNGPSPGAPLRVLVFPVENLTAARAPAREIGKAIELRLARAGLEVVTGEALERFLAAHRIRYTGGIDDESARAAREDLGADGIVLPSLEQYSAEGVPAFAMTMRLVSTEQPHIVWMDAFARTGDDALGLFGVGVIGRIDLLLEEALDRFSRSLVAGASGSGPAGRACDDGRAFRPRVSFRSPTLEPQGSYSVAVLPFSNFTGLRTAGEVVALTVLRQLAAIPEFRAIEPGTVRGALLKHRITADTGVSVDTARTLLGDVAADLVITGQVFEFERTRSRVNFSILVLHGRTGEVVFTSTSFNDGTDAVLFFGLGRVSTSSALACRMARNVVEGMAGKVPAKPRRGGGPADWTEKAFGRPKGHDSRGTPPPAP